MVYEKNMLLNNDQNAQSVVNAPPYPLFFRFSRSIMPQCHDTCRTFLPQCRSVFLPQCLVVVSSCRNACRSVLPLCLAACVRSVFRRVFPQRLPYCLAVVSYRSVLSQCPAVCRTAPAALPCCRFGDSCLEMQVASARKDGSRPDAVTGWSTSTMNNSLAPHKHVRSVFWRVFSQRLPYCFAVVSYRSVKD